MNTEKQKDLRIVTESGSLSSTLRWISDEEVSFLPLAERLLYS
jgi:mitochondrial intermediate peptidase